MNHLEAIRPLATNNGANMSDTKSEMLELLDKAATPCNDSECLYPSCVAYRTLRRMIEGGVEAIAIENKEPEFDKDLSDYDAGFNSALRAVRERLKGKLIMETHERPAR